MGNKKVVSSILPETSLAQSVARVSNLGKVTKNGLLQSKKKYSNYQSATSDTCENKKLV